MDARFRGKIIGSLLAMVALTACGDSDDSWATEAEAWLAAWQQAGSEGFFNRLYFMDEDFVFEDRAGGRELRGRDDFIQFGEHVVAQYDPTLGIALFLSADALLEQAYWLDPAPIDWLDRMVMGPTGAIRAINGPAVDGGRRYAPGVRDFDAIEALADRYVALWNGNDPTEAADLYDPKAWIEDTLLGQAVHGLDLIASSVGTEEWPDLPTSRISDLGEWPETATRPSSPRGRAIYIAASQVDPSVPDEVRIVLEFDDGLDCLVLIAVELAWDGERVLWERRYHEIESVRRCQDTTRLRPGWWEGIQVPDPVRIEETEAMVWEEAGITIPIFNGNPGVQELVRWGLERYAEAGMTLPRIGSVTLLVQESRCRGFLGFLGWDTSAGDVILCFTPEQVCLDANCQSWTRLARLTILHEYAHAWLHANLDAAEEEEFLAFEGVPRWADPNDPWDDRGMERAADTMAFGLTNELRLIWFLTRACEHWQEGFRIITGREPLSVCPQK